MFAAAAGHSTLGIPKSVGREFADADTGGKLPARAKSKAVGRYAKGGMVRHLANHPKGFATGGTVDTLGGGSNTDTTTDDQGEAVVARREGASGGGSGGGAAAPSSSGKMDIIGGQGPSIGFSGSGAATGAKAGAALGEFAGLPGALAGGAIGAGIGGIAGGSSLGTKEDAAAQDVGDIGKGDITALGNIGNASDLPDITSGYAKGGKVKHVAHRYRRSNFGAGQQPPTGGLAGVAQSPPGGGQGSYPSGMAAAGAGAPGGAAGTAGGPGGMTHGGKIKHVEGKPIGKDDGIIAAQRGEFVVRKSAVKKLGTATLEEINKGRLPKSKATDRYRRKAA